MPATVARERPTTAVAALTWALMCVAVGCQLHAPAKASTWNCSVLSNLTLAPAVWWTKHNCTGYVPGSIGPLAHVGPVVVNIVHAMLSDGADSPLLRPAVARTTLGLARLHELALNVTVEAPGFLPLAGVNGGWVNAVLPPDTLLLPPPQAHISSIGSQAHISSIGCRSTTPYIPSLHLKKRLSNECVGLVVSQAPCIPCRPKKNTPSLADPVSFTHLPATLPNAMHVSPTTLFPP